MEYERRAPDTVKYSSVQAEMRSIIKKRKAREINGFSGLLAPPGRFELPTFRLGVDPIRHRQVTPDAKKCLEIQAFSVFPIPSDTML